MTSLVELNPTDHKNLKVVANVAGKLASQMQIVNITAQEIPQACSEFPVFFTRNSQTGDWGASVLISLLQNTSPMLEGEQWQGLYTPNFLRTYPLYPMRREDSNTYSLGIDPASPHLSDTEGEPLYTEDGKDSAFLDGVRRMIDSDIKSGYQTYLMTKELAEQGLFKAVDLVLQFKDGTRQNLHGLFTINEENFQKLSAEKLQEYHQKGYLVVMHAVLTSMYQLNRLVRLHEHLITSDTDDKDQVISVKVAAATSQ